MATKRYLDLLCRKAMARIDSGDGYGRKYGSLIFEDEDEEEVHRVYIREEQFKQIYEDLKKYFSKKEAKSDGS